MEKAKAGQDETIIKGTRKLIVKEKYTTIYDPRLINYPGYHELRQKISKFIADSGAEWIMVPNESAAELETILDEYPESPKKEFNLGEEFDDLYQKLETLPKETDKKQVVEIAEQMKQIIIQNAKGTERGKHTYEHAVNQLIFVLFNRFQITDYDELYKEVDVVQKNPKVFRDLETIEEAS